MSELNDLPWLPLSELRVFPASPCVYFVSDDKMNVLYVGMTQDARQRWQGHHRYNAAIEMGCTRVYFRFCALAEIKSLEAKMIRKYRPALNVVGVPRKKPKQKSAKSQKLHGQKRYITPGKRLQCFHDKWCRENFYPSIAQELEERIGDLPSNGIRFILSEKTRIPFYSVPRGKVYSEIRKSINLAAKSMASYEAIASYYGLD